KLLPQARRHRGQARPSGSRHRAAAPLPGLVSGAGLTNQITKRRSRGDIGATDHDAHSSLGMCRQPCTWAVTTCLISTGATTRHIINVSAVHQHCVEVSKGPMSNFPTEILSSERIASLEQDVIEEAEAGRKDGAWQKLQPLRQAQQHQYEATNSLLRIIGQR